MIERPASRSASPLTIGIDCRFIQDKFHGIGRYTYHLLQHLCSSPGEHTVVAYVDPAVPNSRFPLDMLRRQPRCELRAVHIPLYHPVELVAWRAALRARPIDVFHTPYFWAPALLPCPLVTTIHDMIFDRYPEYMPQRHLAMIYRIASRAAMRQSRQIIAVSQATGDDIVQLTRTPASKVCVVPEGVDAAFGPIANAEQLRDVRARYDLPASYVLALGARRPHKNIGRLVEAFSQIADAVPHALVLVGAIDTRFTAGVSETLDRLRQAGRVREIGHVAEADLPSLYTLADLFVQPSIIEGFGLPLLEAMACGCPVACANTSSLPEVGGDAAIQFDPYDVAAIATSLTRALGAPDMRADMARRGLSRARMFRWETAAAQTLDVYRRAAGGRHG